MKHEPIVMKRRGMIAAFASFRRHRGGASAVEFALVLPLFGLILAGVADFGGALYAKFGLDSAVAAAANYALVNATNVNSTSGASLATNLATILASARATNWATGTVVVNNGPSATVNSSGTVTSGGTASKADLYYCPTGSGASVAWGSSVAQGVSCTGGGTAGKFITIVARRSYNPIFSSYGLVKNGTITAAAVVQAQ
ncbi:TadE/TadG family type IV pilus assembly protein [Methyloferula stellata]|uniref:TadE/TadG family type IV pilus assembly protein n=1 Tax=Methyloferula stellata TaxID=876270 RepID=UPI0031379A8E